MHAAVVEFAVCVTRLGDFWKFLAKKFLSKVAQIFGNLLGYSEKHYFVSKNCCGSFSPLLGKFGLLFIPRSGHTGFNLSVLQTSTTSTCVIHRARVNHCHGFSLRRIEHLWDERKILKLECQNFILKWTIDSRMSKRMNDDSLSVEFTTIRLHLNWRGDDCSVSISTIDI